MNDRYLQQYVKAVSLIRDKFEDKVDKGGHPYINHLFNVDRSAKKIWDDLKLNCAPKDVLVFYEKCRVVALLHDILEDTDVTIDELKENGFDDDIIDAIVCITRLKIEKKYEPYSEFIERVKNNDIAKCVKIFDLEDNMDIKRLSSLGEKDFIRLNKYFHSWRYLRGIETKEEYNNNLNIEMKIWKRS